MEHSLSRQTARYVIVGGVVYAIDLCLFILLMAALPQDYYLLINMAAKIVAAIVGFFLHKHFTFSWEQRHSVTRQFILYAVLFAFTMGLSTGLVYLLVGYLTFPALPSRILVDVLVIATAFFVSRHIVFRGPRMRVIGTK